MHIYYPTRYEEHKGVSESLIAFKQGYQIPIDRFTIEVEEALHNLNGGDTSTLEGKYIALVPSHTKGQWSSSMKKMTAKICANFKMVNYSDSIERTQDHPKLAYGGDRSIESHIQTLGVKPGCEIKGKEIIVMDDITTTGNSILACARVLRDAGAKKVMAIALAKTY